VSRDYHLHSAPVAATLRISYERELNPQQLAAVTAGPGPCLVLAGAGAGKTRTLTYRVAWLLEHGVPPDRILLLTFTNRSAREMMQRVGELLGGDPPGLWGGTFHSIGNRILRRHADRLGHRPDFTIADREDARDLLGHCITEAGVDVKATRFPKPEVLGDLFSMAVNTRRDLTSLLASTHSSFVPLTEAILDVQKRYIERKQANGVMDFDDLLVLWLRLMTEHADLREMYQRRFQHLLVDEYQDTNALQGELLDSLTAPPHNLMAVGDDAQSIYSWRGAHFANILDFPKRHGGARVHKIEINYRSTPEILALANAAIRPNTRQYPKELQAARPSGPRPVKILCGDASEQAAFVAQRALELREEGRRLDDICVLYRSHFHALELQLELTRRNIPFSITSGLRFFEQAHIKDVAAYLKLVSNGSDELAFRRLVRMLPGIGAKGADKLWSVYAEQRATRAPELLYAPAAAPISDLDGALEPAPAAAVDVPQEVARSLAAITPKVPKKAAAAWAQFTATVAQCEEPGVRRSPGRMIRLVVEADYEDYVNATFDNPSNRLDDLEQLAAYANQFQGTADFLAQLALQSELEAASEQSRNDEEEDRLRLSTVHQAKGLEFGVVFVIMLCDGLFPSQRSVDTTEGEEEERRLFYVALTRAKDELYLSHALLRFAQGSGNALQRPSRFLSDFPAELVEEWNLRPAGPVSQYAAYPPPSRNAEPADPDPSIDPDADPDDMPF
jgi:DNA helicase-2/ATP-dependent DNA helicase PcrA